MDKSKPWYWEGNVASALGRHLEREGWTIRRMADTRVKERGIDLEAFKDGQILIAEVKGYPTKTYNDPGRAGEAKPSHPSNQAGHWFSRAILAAMRLQTKHPEAIVALALPDFPRYHKLIGETRQGLLKLDVVLLIVEQDGRVRSENWAGERAHSSNSQVLVSST